MFGLIRQTWAKLVARRIHAHIEARGTAAEKLLGVVLWMADKEGAVIIEFRRSGRMWMFVPTARGFEIRPLVRFCSYGGVPYRERFDVMSPEEIAAELDRYKEELDEHPTMVELEGHLTRGIRPLVGMFDESGTKARKPLFVRRIDRGVVVAIGDKRHLAAGLGRD